MLLARLRPVALALTAALALAYAVTAFEPPRYAATARVLLPMGDQGSRVLKLESRSSDPHRATAAVDALVRAHASRDAVVIDEANVLPVRASLALNLAFGAVAGLSLGIGLVLLQARRRRPVRSEKHLIEALGDPLFAARPLQPEALRTLCEQLLAHWFVGSRSLLAVVSPDSGDGRSRLAAQLAAGLAAMGASTLLVDADLRAPSQHRRFRVPNRAGLGDFLEGRGLRLARCAENLSLMVAGSARSDPLELLSRQRLQALLGEAGTRHRVVLVDTPAAARGPDLQMFAALAGGALVVARTRSADGRALQELQHSLKRCNARVVATVVNRD